MSGPGNLYARFFCKQTLIQVPLESLKQPKLSLESPRSVLWLINKTKSSVHFLNITSHLKAFDSLSDCLLSKLFFWVNQIVNKASVVPKPKRWRSFPTSLPQKTISKRSKKKKLFILNFSNYFPFGIGCQSFFFSHFVLFLFARLVRLFLRRNIFTKKNFNYDNKGDGGGVRGEPKKKSGTISTRSHSICALSKVFLLLFCPPLLGKAKTASKHAIATLTLAPK